MFSKEDLRCRATFRPGSLRPRPRRGSRPSSPAPPPAPEPSGANDRTRKTGDADAAVDPLSDPKIRDAVARATFEHLVGFQLSQDQLRYNATR